MEKHVFVSHKHEDTDFAQVLVNKIEKAGFKTWVDHDQLHIGEDWRFKIDQAMKNSFVLIVIMSPEAKNSEYVTYEWAFAWGAGIRVFPILYKDTPLHPRLEALQHLNFTTLTLRPWDKLIEALKKAAEAYSEPISQTVLPPQVIDEVVSLLATALASRAGTTIQSTHIEKTKEAAERINQLITSDTPRQLSKATVLWVDDRPTNNNYEQQALHAFGIRITNSLSTEDALKRLSQTKYDVIISDMGRPPDKQAGYTLLRKIKERQIDIPFIIYAGSRAPEHIAEALGKGAVGTTNIPTELFEMVINAIKSGKQHL